MNAEEMAAIRERAEEFPADESIGDEDRRALLAHIDALTAKVEALPHLAWDEVYVEGKRSPVRIVDMDAVITILRGEA